MLIYSMMSFHSWPDFTLFWQQFVVVLRSSTPEVHHVSNVRMSPYDIDNSHTACYPSGAVVQGALYDVRAALERGAAKNTDPILWGRGEK